MDEIWVGIDGFPGYKISNFGNVKSSRFGHKETGYNKRPINNNGRIKVALRKDGKNYLLTLGVLVAKAFVEPYHGDVVFYLDGDNTNCREDNLRWMSYQEFGEQIRIKNMQAHGDKSSLASEIKRREERSKKLKRALLVKELRDQGLSYSEIGRQLNISESGAYRIYAGKNNKMLEKASGIE